MVAAGETATLLLVEKAPAEEFDWLEDSVIRDVVPSMVLWLPVMGIFTFYQVIMIITQILFFC